MTESEKKTCRELAKKIRQHCLQMVYKGKSGHIGSMLSMADILPVTYTKILHVDPKNPKMEDRDRFLLSKGHGGAALLALLAELGFFDKSWLNEYYCDNGKLSGHISHHIPGVEFSTGSLGHGLPVACGMAMAAKQTNKKHRIFCMSSDGDLNEGSSWEAIMLAGQHHWDNLGALHYQNRFYQGTRSSDLSDAYRTERRMAVKPGGTAWFFGGAGAMGQMHVELAAVTPGHAGKILVSDLDDSRLAHLRRHLEKRAEENGVECRFVNPSKMSPEEFEALLRDFAPKGFDDILLLVPSAKCGSDAAAHLGRNGLMNVFAGIPAGDTGVVSIRDIVENGVRFTGSSGSSMNDMIDTVRAAAEGEFLSVSALGAIGGMKDLKKGLEHVAKGSFPGKTVIFPNCPDLPLTAMSDLSQVSPELPATLDSNGFYTKETEQLILKQYEEKQA